MHQSSYEKPDYLKPIPQLISRRQRPLQLIVQNVLLNAQLQLDT